MLRTRLGQRYFSTTRGRIVLLLRQSHHTVDELTGLLGVTRNAVREHLAMLERDGLVQRSGVRRGVGKPAYLYALSAEAAELFPRGYAPVLGGLLDVLAEQFNRPRCEALLRDAGYKLVAGRPAPRGNVQARVAAAAELLSDLGGFAEGRDVEGTFVIQGLSCPLAAVAVDHPELCLLVGAMIAQFIGLPVQEQCDRREPPRCVFVVAPTAPSGTGAS